MGKVKEGKEGAMSEKKCCGIFAGRLAEKSSSL
jgi:hypothetical protein